MNYFAVKSKKVSMPHSQNNNCQSLSTRMEQSTSDFIRFFRMRPASSHFTNFRRASSRQFTRQVSLRTTTKDFVTRQSSRNNSQTMVHWNDSPARSAVIITDVFLRKRIVDFKKHIRCCWRCSRINLSVYTIKVCT